MSVQQPTCCPYFISETTHQGFYEIWNLRINTRSCYINYIWQIFVQTLLLQYRVCQNSNITLLCLICVKVWRYILVRQRNLYPSLFYALFSGKYRSFFLVPVNRPYKRVTVLYMSLLEVSFSYIIQNSWSWPTVLLEWLFLEGGKKQKWSDVFWNVQVAVICLHCHFWEKLLKSCDVFGMYNSCNLHVRTLAGVTCHLNHVRNTLD
jgi:hypothetical protein